VAHANVDERVIKAGATWHRACYSKAYPDKAPAAVRIEYGIVYVIITHYFVDIFRDWELILNLVPAVDSYLLQARIPETKP